MTIPENSEILAVDDTPDNLLLLEAILSEHPAFKLTCADSGVEAIQAIETSPPDLILLDVMMPGMNGYEVARRIRQSAELPYIPILFVTADKNIDEKTGIRAGADGLVYKPFDIGQLIERICSLLRCCEGEGCQCAT
ncbi:MAG: response regulator [Cyanobacteria bacterium J06614_10]